MKRIPINIDCVYLKKIWISGPNSIYVGETKEWKAFGLYSDGSQRELTYDVSWGSRYTLLDSVDFNKFKGIKEGEATLKIIYGEKSASEKITIIGKPEEKADLAIQSITWEPENPKEGDTVTFTVKTKNQGSKSASGFYVCYYVDGSYYARDYVRSLSDGLTTTTSFSWTANTCGSHSIKAVVDCYNAVTESNEDNNERTKYINIVRKPDLIVQDISWDKDSPKQGDKITFTVKIENKEAGDAGGFYVYYYIDGSNVNSNYISSLSAGATSTQTFTWTANECGDIQVKAVADATNTVNESNENNNEKTKTLHIRCPDLKVESVTYSPKEVYQGTMITVTAKIKNIGDADAEGSNTNIEFTDSTGQSKGGEVVKIGALSVGEETTIEKNYLMQQTGKRILSVEANYDKAVKESDYSNNKKKVTIEVIGISISVKVYNVNKGKLAWDGKINVRAYDENNKRVASENKTFKSAYSVNSVTVSLQVPSNASLIRVFQTPEIKDGFQEYWGSMYIYPMRETEYEFTRHTSWISDDITIDDLSIYSDTINLNKKGIYDIAIPVTNSGHSKSSVIVEVKLDRDEEKPWDFYASNSISIDPGEEEDVHLTYVKNKETTGIWKFRAIVKEEYGSKGIADTDQHAWYIIVDKGLLDREFYLGIVAQSYYEFISLDADKTLDKTIEDTAELYNSLIIGSSEDVAKDSLLQAIKDYDDVLGGLFEAYTSINDLINFARNVQSILNNIMIATDLQLIKRTDGYSNAKQYSSALGSCGGIQERIERWKSGDEGAIEDMLTEENQNLSFMRGFADSAKGGKITTEVRQQLDNFSHSCFKQEVKINNLYYELVNPDEDEYYNFKLKSNWYSKANP